MLRRLGIALVGLAAGTAILAAAPAEAQNYPTRNLTVIVGTTPGGQNDAFLQLVNEAFKKEFGYGAVSEYKPGAGGMLAGELVAKAKPDGYTLWFGSVGPLAINPAIGNTKYDIDKDFVPVAMTLATPNVLVVGPAIKAKTVQELIKEYKEGNKRITFASGGVAGSSHMAGELFKSVTGLNLVHVPYKSQSDAVTDVIGGRVDILFAGIGGVSSFIQSGQLRPLLVTTKKRIPNLPDVPTSDEAGLQGLYTLGYIGYIAPAGTPKDIVDKLNGAVNRAMMTEEGKKVTYDSAGDGTLFTPEEFAAFLKSERTRWLKVIQDNKLELK